MTFRNAATFRHPAEFVPVSEEDGVLSIERADFFVDLLGRIPGRVVINPELCQESATAPGLDESLHRLTRGG